MLPPHIHSVRIRWKHVCAAEARLQESDVCLKLSGKQSIVVPNTHTYARNGTKRQTPAGHHRVRQIRTRPNETQCSTASGLQCEFSNTLKCLYSPLPVIRNTIALPESCKAASTCALKQRFTHTHTHTHNICVSAFRIWVDNSTQCTRYDSIINCTRANTNVKFGSYWPQSSPLTVSSAITDTRNIKHPTLTQYHLVHVANWRYHLRGHVHNDYPNRSWNTRARFLQQTFQILCCFGDCYICLEQVVAMLPQIHALQSHLVSQSRTCTSAVNFFFKKHLTLKGIINISSYSAVNTVPAATSNEAEWRKYTTF